MDVTNDAQGNTKAKIESLPDPSISSEHTPSAAAPNTGAQSHSQQQDKPDPVQYRYYIMDLGSLNGLYIDGIRVCHQLWTPLHEGARLRFAPQTENTKAYIAAFQAADAANQLRRQANIAAGGTGAIGTFPLIAPALPESPLECEDIHIEYRFTHAMNKAAARRMDRLNGIVATGEEVNGLLQQSLGDAAHLTFPSSCRATAVRKRAAGAEDGCDPSKRMRTDDLKANGAKSNDSNDHLYDTDPSIENHTMSTTVVSGISSEASAAPTAAAARVVPGRALDAQQDESDEESVSDAMMAEDVDDDEMEEHAFLVGLKAEAELAPAAAPSAPAPVTTPADDNAASNVDDLVNAPNAAAPVVAVPTSDAASGHVDAAPSATDSVATAAVGVAAVPNADHVATTVRVTPDQLPADCERAAHAAI